jgi:aryl-alcohol dehydrogenase-like predicted oxidoreductase
MLKRAIPSSGELLPVIGLGTWRSFDISEGAAERSSRTDVLNALFDMGGSVIDSSPMYGAAERVVGDLLTDYSDDAFVATKFWTEGKQHGIDQMCRSMELLSVDVIDLMQIHNLVDWRTHLSTLRDWKEQGLIRYIGITHYTTRAFDQLESIIASEKIDFVQPPYSLALRDAEDRLLPLAADKGVAVVVNRPFDGGSMFGPVRGKELPDWAKEFDCGSWAVFFSKYLLGDPAVTYLIPATGTPSYMADNLAAGKGSLPDVEMRRQIVKPFESL